MFDDIKRPAEPLTGGSRQTPKPVDTAPQDNVLVNETGSIGMATAPHPSLHKHRQAWHPKVIYAKITGARRIVIASVLAVAVIGGTGSYLIFQNFKKQPTAASSVTSVEPKVTEPAKPTTEPSRLTGLETTTELNTRPVTGVMIENSPEARPQSGLMDAGIIFEAIAEGGITRFLALFQESRPDYIGPVRSARPYYLDWLMAFDASYAHVGGSPDALSQIKTLGIKDLDQFANAGSYQRVSNRYAPHNVYTSMDKLDALNQKKGFTTSTFASLPRKAEAASAAPTAKSIDMNVSAFLYNPRYDYDAATNSYKRSMAGKPHTDERSGEQLAPKTVIALVMPRSLAGDKLHSVYGTTGSGAMYVFQDGLVVQGKWTKADRKAQFVFADGNGAPLKLNAGQTWITMVNAANAVTYKP